MTAGDTPGRQQLTDTAADAYRARREALHATVSDLDAALDALETQDLPDVERFRAVLTQVLETLHEHIQQADAPDGLLAEIIETAPWFAPRAETLRSEHDELLVMTRELIERAGAGGEFGTLLADARTLSARIADHRHTGTSLLMDAYMLDVPAGD